MISSVNNHCTCRSTVEPFLRGHSDERPTPLKRPLDIVNLSKNVLISSPDKRPPLLKGHISGPKGVAKQEGFHCMLFSLSIECFIGATIQNTDFYIPKFQRLLQ